VKWAVRSRRCDLLCLQHTPIIQNAELYRPYTSSFCSPSCLLLRCHVAARQTTNSRIAAIIAHHVDRAKGNNSPSDDVELRSGSFMYSIFLFRDNKTGECTYSVTMTCLRVTTVALEMSFTQLKCVSVALVIQHALRMRHIAICGLPRSTIFFPHYLINGTIFGKKVTEHKMCVLIFCTTFVRKISHCKKN